MTKPIKYPHRRLIQFDDELKERIETFRFSRRHKTESDAIRALLVAGLDACNGKQKEQVRELTHERLDQPPIKPKRRG